MLLQAIIGNTNVESIPFEYTHQQSLWPQRPHTDMYMYATYTQLLCSPACSYYGFSKEI